MRVLRLTHHARLTEVLADWQNAYPGAQITRRPPRLTMPWDEHDDLVVEFRALNEDALRGRNYDVVVYGDVDPRHLSDDGKRTLALLTFSARGNRNSTGHDLMPLGVAWHLALVGADFCEQQECVMSPRSARWYQPDREWIAVCEHHSFGPVQRA